MKLMILHMRRRTRIISAFGFYKFKTQTLRKTVSELRKSKMFAELLSSEKDKRKLDILARTEDEFDNDNHLN
jgi:hypothetical protein